MVDVLQVVVLRQQRRAHSRLRVALDVVLDGVPATTLDIAPNGVGVTMPFEPTVGAVTTLSVELPSIQGPMATIRGRALVRDVRATTTPGYWRVGLEFTHLSETARLALVEFCAVGHVLEHDPAHADLPTAPVGQLAVRREGHHHRSLQVMTAAAAVAAVVTLGIGPCGRQRSCERYGQPSTRSAPRLPPVTLWWAPSSSPQARAAHNSWAPPDRPDVSGSLRLPRSRALPSPTKGLRRPLDVQRSLPPQSTARSPSPLVQHSRTRGEHASARVCPTAEIRYFTDRWISLTGINRSRTDRRRSQR